MGYVPPVEAQLVTHSLEEHGGALPGTSGFDTSRGGSFIGCFCDVLTYTKVEKSVNVASGMMSMQNDPTLNGRSPREGWALEADAALLLSAGRQAK